MQELIKKLCAWYRDAPTPSALTTGRPEVVEAFHWSYCTASLLSLANRRLTVEGSYDRSAKPSWIGLSGYYTCADFDWAPLSASGGALVGGMTPNALEHVLKIKKKIKIPKKQLITHENKPIVVIGGHENYYHFIVDVLPRLLSVYYSGLLKQGWMVAISNDKNDLMGQSTRILNISADNIIWLNKDSDHWFSRAVYITNANINAQIHPLTYLLLDRFKGKMKAPFLTDRIFVSRSRISRRRLINEEKIIKKLQDRRFCVVHPELMSFQQQIEAFRGAQVVIGVHGSGLTNLLWAERPRILLELCGSQSSAFFGTPDIHFATMVRSMSFCKYRRLRAKTENTIHPGDHQSDFFIDPSDVLEQIDKLISVHLSDDADK